MCVKFLIGSLSTFILKCSGVYFSLCAAVESKNEFVRDLGVPVISVHSIIKKNTMTGTEYRHFYNKLTFGCLFTDFSSKAVSSVCWEAHCEIIKKSFTVQTESNKVLYFNEIYTSSMSSPE